MSIETKKKFLINIAFGAVIVILAYMIFQYFLGLLLPFLMAFLVAAMLRPLVRMLSKKFRFTLRFSSVVCNIFFFGIIGTLLFFGGARMIAMIAEIFSGLPVFYQRTLEPALQTAMRSIEDFLLQFDITPFHDVDQIIPKIITAVGDMVTRFSMNVVNFISGFAAGLPSVLVNLLIMIIATFFFSLDYEGITQFLLRPMSSRTKKIVLDMKRHLFNVILRYGKSYFIILCITFFELSIGLACLKVNNFWVVAAVIALVDILPVLGTGIVILPWAAFSLLQSKYFLGIGLLVLYVIITIIRQIIEPRIIGKQVGLHPIITLITMFVGMNLFGFIGMFGLPITAAIIQSLLESGSFKILEQTDTPSS